jgi:hypothetical protein
MKIKGKSTSKSIKNLDYDTKIGTIEHRFGIKFDMPSDTKLGVFLKKQGYPSLSAMLLSS